MHKRSIQIHVLLILSLLFSLVLFAQDKPISNAVLSTPSTAPAPIAAEKEPAIKVKPFGYVNYRFRADADIEKKTNEANPQKFVNYGNQLGFMFGVDISLNDALSFKAEIGNKYMETPAIKYVVVENPDWGPYIHLAEAKWKNKILSLSFGIVTIKNYGALDLLDKSLRTATYQQASELIWTTYQESGFAGVRIDTPILKKNLKLDLNVLYSILKSSKLKNGKEAPDSHLIVSEMPIKMGKFSLVPQVAVVINRLYNTNTEKGDHEVLAGGQFTFTPNKALSLMLDGGFGTFNNEDSQVIPVKIGDKENTNNVSVTRKGAILGLTEKIALNDHILISLFQKVSWDANTDSASSGSVYYYADFWFQYTVKKYLTLWPRFRFYYTTYANKKLETDIRLRPEMILQLKF